MQHERNGKETEKRIGEFLKNFLENKLILEFINVIVQWNVLVIRILGLNQLRG